MRLLPLFPLQIVVYPRTQMPLHIFEERYKEMVGEAIAAKSEFGVVLARDKGIVNLGCSVLVDRVLTTYPDGRMDIVTRGVRRFEIQSLDQEKDYLRAEVEFFDDENFADIADDLKQEVLAGYRSMLEANEGKSVAEPVLTDPQLSFQLAQAVEDLDFQAVLLKSRSEAERLRQLGQYFRQQVPRLKNTNRMKQLAPLNGFGHKPAGL